MFAYRFNRLAWGYGDGSRRQGVIAAGLENGELALWDPASILDGAGYGPAFQMIHSCS
jgi:protein transport protein SEC31